MSKTKPYAYGEIVCETDQIDFMKAEQDRLVEHHGYRRGDSVNLVDLDKYTYVLVISDEDYVDVEYRRKCDGMILTRSEIVHGVENE